MRPKIINKMTALRKHRTKINCHIRLYATEFYCPQIDAKMQPGSMVFTGEMDYSVTVTMKLNKAK